MATQHAAAVLSTRGLMLTLCRSGRRRTALLSLARPLACPQHEYPKLGQQQRGFFWKKDDGNKPDDKDASPKQTSSNSKAEPEKKAEAEVQKSSSSNVTAASKETQATDASSASEGAVVPISAAELRRDTGPDFEPNMIALPLSQRPIIPGQHQMLQVTHPAVIKEIQDAMTAGKPTLYVGAFLRKEIASDFTDSNSADNNAASTEDFSNVDPRDALYMTGTRSRVVQAVPSNVFNNPNKDGEKGDDEPPEGLQVLLHGKDLVHMDKVLDAGPPLHVQVSKVQLTPAPKDGPGADEVKAYINETMQTVREIMKINPQFREHASLIHSSMQRMQNGDPHSIAHFAACLTTGTGAELMKALETENPAEKLKLVLALVQKELELSQLQEKLSNQIKEKVDARQREFMLREQLKMIKKELGEDKSDGPDLLLDKFKKALEGKTVPHEAKEAIDAEMEKLSGLAKESQEFQITRNYLDWLTVLPWGKYSEDTLNLQKARTILDQDHHGLADVKKRILELIAVGKLRGSVQGKIVCFVGPPGVGKTSIGKSIAQALGREFYRFSVGGLYDVAEIKGHRRTYVGAMPGKVVQCLKKTQSANPLVLIDEIDKIGRGHNGDPSSALLELLDPSQNGSFMDHYLDVPVDASKILFVCTANVTDTIPAPLLDRMEVIRLSGYDSQEKLKIAEDHLIPKSMREMGLWPMPEEKPATDSTSPSESGTASSDTASTTTGSTGSTESTDDKPSAEADKLEAASEQSTAIAKNEGGAPDAKIEQSAVESLIRWYCREAGVRNLEKHIEKICRKLASNVVEHQELGDEANVGEDSQAAEGTSSGEKPEPPNVIVTEDRLSDILGKPPFTSDRLYESDLPVGTVTGLAWTAMGGSVLYMEAIALPRHEGKPASPSLRVTGQLGDVMKESSQLALLLARRQLTSLGPESRKSFFEEHELYLHCPEGAVPKDGPSAGVTMVTALMSLGLDMPIRTDLAMTGEVSLNGKVLAIGGVKEKTIAARRAGCKTLVFPNANRRDFDELPEYLKEGLEVHYATDYSDVFAVAFADYEKISS